MRSVTTSGPATGVGVRDDGPVTDTTSESPATVVDRYATTDVPIGGAWGLGLIPTVYRVRAPIFFKRGVTFSWSCFSPRWTFSRMLSPRLNAAERSVH